MDADFKNTLVGLLKVDEGVAYRVYNDTMGIPTIGVGRNLRDNGLDDNEVDFLLQNDVRRVDNLIELYFPWVASHDAVRRLVLYSLVFNMGVRKVQAFTKMLAAMIAKDYVTAAKELQNSLWYKQVGNRGPKLCQMLKTGEQG